MLGKCSFTDLHSLPNPSGFVSNFEAGYLKLSRLEFAIFLPRPPKVLGLWVYATRPDYVRLFIFIKTGGKGWRACSRLGVPAVSAGFPSLATHRLVTPVSFQSL